MVDHVEVIYSYFHETLGPIPKISFPKLDKKFSRNIAQKSIDLLSAEEIMNSKALAFLPFPAEKKKGIIRCIEWTDESLRGDVGTGSLTLIFDESDDAIFYKYIKDLEAVFDEAAEKIINLNIDKADNSTFETTIKEIHENFQKWLKDLESQEIGASHDSEAFPEPEAIDESEKFTFKVVICGDFACGKTSTVLRFTDSAFRRTYIPTIGVNVSKKEVLIDNKNIFLVLWDIAGQQKFSFIRGQFYQGAHATIIVYDVTRKETFNDIKNWHIDMKKYLGYDGTSIDILCGNKIDLQHMREVSTKEAEALANELGLHYFETSALTGENINEIFSTIAKTLAATVDN